MSEPIRKSLSNRAPFDGRPGSAAAPAANDFGMKKFTGGVSGTETTHKADALPSLWAGHEVGLMATGGVCYVGFSKRADAAGAATGEIQRDVAATAAGASDKVGIPIPNSLSVETRLRLPNIAPGESLFFIRESDTVGTVVYMRCLD